MLVPPAVNSECCIQWSGLKATTTNSFLLTWAYYDLLERSWGLMELWESWYWLATTVTGDYEGQHCSSKKSLIRPCLVLIPFLWLGNTICRSSVLPDMEIVHSLTPFPVLFFVLFCFRHLGIILGNWLFFFWKLVNKGKESRIYLAFPMNIPLSS